MKRLKSIVFAALAVFVAVASIAPMQASAAASSASLSIAPKKNYVIEPGETVKDTLTIRNLDSSAPLELTLRVVDFTFTDDGGTPKIFLAEDAPQTTWSLKPFLTLPKTVTIPARASKTLDMKLTVPAGHGAGSYYSAIIYSSGAPGEGGNVGLSASGVTLVFTSVPGQVNEDLKLEKFGAYFTQGGYAFFTQQEPQMIGYTLKNNGNVTEAPVGSIKLRDIFGREQTITDVNPNGSLALIGQTRTFTSCIKLKQQNVDFDGTQSQAKECTSPGLWPGPYTASLDIFYGQNGNLTKEITKTVTFWYMPLWFVIALLVIIAIISYYVWRVTRKIRRIQHGRASKKPLRRK